MHENVYSSIENAGEKICEKYPYHVIRQIHSGTQILDCQFSPSYFLAYTAIPQSSPYANE